MAKAVCKSSQVLSIFLCLTVVRKPKGIDLAKKTVYNIPAVTGSQSGQYLPQATWQYSLRRHAKSETTLWTAENWGTCQTTYLNHSACVSTYTNSTSCITDRFSIIPMHTVLIVNHVLVLNVYIRCTHLYHRVQLDEYPDTVPHTLWVQELLHTRNSSFAVLKLLSWFSVPINELGSFEITGHNVAMFTDYYCDWPAISKNFSFGLVAQCFTPSQWAPWYQVDPGYS